MTNDRQRRIIQEQVQANERIVRAVERRNASSGRFEGQAPVNERIRQIGPNERIKPAQAPPQQSSRPKK